MSTYNGLLATLLFHDVLLQMVTRLFGMCLLLTWLILLLQKFKPCAVLVLAISGVRQSVNPWESQLAADDDQFYTMLEKCCYHHMNVSICMYGNPPCRENNILQEISHIYWRKINCETENKRHNRRSLKTFQFPFKRENVNIASEKNASSKNKFWWNADWIWWPNLEDVKRPTDLPYIKGQTCCTSLTHI